MPTKVAEVVLSRHLEKTSLEVGQIFENATWRIQRMALSVKAFELANAGKRGKMVPVIVLYGEGIPESVALEMVLHAKRGATFDRMLQAFKENKEVFPQFDLDVNKLKGIDVAPGGFKKIKVQGQHVEVEVDFSSFVVRNLDDKNNEPTAISMDKKSVPPMYVWVRDNLEKIPNMKYRDVTRGMLDAGIKFHDYCAID